MRQSVEQLSKFLQGRDESRKALIKMMMVRMTTIAMMTVMMTPIQNNDDDFKMMTMSSLLTNIKKILTE